MAMTRVRRPSAQTTAVVLAFSEQPATWRYGYELCQQLGLKAGSVYPILMRLADRGLLETAWERHPPPRPPPPPPGPGRRAGGGGRGAWGPPTRQGSPRPPGLAAGSGGD